MERLEIGRAEIVEGCMTSFAIVESYNVEEDIVKSMKRLSNAAKITVITDKLPLARRIKDEAFIQFIDFIDDISKWGYSLETGELTYTTMCTTEQALDNDHKAFFRSKIILDDQLGAELSIDNEKNHPDYEKFDYVKEFLKIVEQE